MMYDHGTLRGPSNATPPEIRPFSGTINHHYLLVRPIFLALGGTPLDSNDEVTGLRFSGRSWECRNFYEATTTKPDWKMSS